MFVGLFIALLLAPFAGDFSPRRIHGFQIYDADEKIIVAHRGGTEMYHENSLEAFEYADKSGVTAIEMDVRKARDGFLVYHDSKINGQKLEELTMDELKEIGIEFKENRETL